MWPGAWFDSLTKLHFGMRYQVVPDRWARHTGADLNLNSPIRNTDADAPIYAIAEGKVTASHKGEGTWGWLIVIEHHDDAGEPFYSRYAHVNHIQFTVARKGDIVTIGTVIAHIGNADGIYGSGHHLHFDISHSKVLKTRPEHWPGDVSEAILRRNYVDPRRFIIENRTEPTWPETMPEETMKVIATTLQIRPQPNTLQPNVGMLRYGDVVKVRGSFSGSGYHFAELLQINGATFTPPGNGKGFVAREFLQTGG